MDSVKYILRKPDYVDGVGEIYPITLENYDEFMNMTNIISLSYDHFQEVIENNERKIILARQMGIDPDDIRLYDLIKFLSLEFENPLVMFRNLENVFSLVLQNTVKFNSQLQTFIIDESGEINRDNYDIVREIIMRQNLLFVPKVYKNKLMQEWAEKALKARAKNSIDSTIEDMITTVSVLGGKTYDQLKKYTIYQLKAEFNRILKIETFRSYQLYKIAGAEDIPNVHFAENIDMFINPYDLSQLVNKDDKLSKVIK